MKTYLDMDEVLRHCRRYIGQEYDEPYLVSAVPEEVIRSLPPADVAPVKHGRWNRDGRCDQCGEHAPFWCMATTYHLSKYCPKCGAKMDEEG